jgi:hypothetical protein
MARLFNALVVLGAGASVSSCGGKAEGDIGDSTGGATSHSGTGGSPAMGGGTSVGGRFGSGGAPSYGGGFASGGYPAGGALATGGVTGVAGTGGLPDEGTLAQWSCQGLFGYCGSHTDPETVYHLPTECPVDTLRPRSAADCPGNEWFECIAAYLLDGTLVKVNCRCAPADALGCSCVDLETSQIVDAACSARTRLCGCAYTGILR